MAQPPAVLPPEATSSISGDGPAKRYAPVPVRVFDMACITFLPDVYLTRQKLEFVVPFDIKKAFANSTYLRFGHDLLQTAFLGSFVTVADEEFGGDPAKEALALKLTSTEYAVLRVARNRQDNAFEVAVVTSSRRLKAACRKFGIETIGILRFRATCQRAPSRIAVDAAVRGILVNETMRLLARLAIGACLAAVTALVVRHSGVIYKEITEVPQIGVALCLLVAALAFILRSRARFYYAVMEIVIGVFAVLAAMPRTGEPTQDGVLKAAGGIYVIVRGMDNLGKSFAGSLAGLWWRQVFGD